MENPIKLIHKFNEDAGLLENGYDDFLESSMLVEEALEGFELPAYIDLSETSDYRDSHKRLSREIVRSMHIVEVPDVDRLDKACDAVIIAIGSMAKLGLNPQQITKALNVVMQANSAKLGMSRDAEGKLMKPENFESPEPKLQQILDERSL